MPKWLSSLDAPSYNILYKKLSNMLHVKLSIEESRKLGTLELGRTPHDAREARWTRIPCKAIACKSGKWC